MRPGRKIEHHHMKAMLYKRHTVKLKTNSIIGLNKVGIKFEFYKRSSNLEKNEFNIPGPDHLRLTNEQQT